MVRAAVYILFAPRISWSGAEIQAISKHADLQFSFNTLDNDKHVALYSGSQIKVFYAFSTRLLEWRFITWAVHESISRSRCQWPLLAAATIVPEIFDQDRCLCDVLYELYE